MDTKDRGANRTTQSHRESSFITHRRACGLGSVEGDFLLEAHSASQKILK